MNRLWQIFVAPGEDYDPLPIDKSPWYIGERRVSIPREHWELILEFVEKIDFEKAEELSLCSCSSDGNEDDFIYISSQRLQELVSFTTELEVQILDAPPLVTEATEAVPDRYINEEHVRMLQAVRAVFQESVRLKEPFRAWIE